MTSLTEAGIDLFSLRSKVLNLEAEMHCSCTAQADENPGLAPGYHLNEVFEIILS